MAGSSTTPLETLERWSPTAFLVAGVLLVAFAASVGLEVFMGVSGPQAFVSIPGFLAALIGLLGLYPKLAEQSPRLARASVVVVALALVGFFVNFTWVVALTAMNGIDAGTPPEPVILLTVLLTILGFILFGVTGLRANTLSRTGGLLLLAPPAVFAVMVAGAIAGYTPGWSTFAIAAMQAVAHLAIGLVLRNADMPTDRAKPAADTTT